MSLRAGKEVAEDSKAQCTVIVGVAKAAGCHAHHGITIKINIGLGGCSLQFCSLRRLHLAYVVGYNVSYVAYKVVRVRLYI